MDDQALFRSVMSRFATGVAVVTTVQDGMDHAMTANSFTSVSLDPPLVLVCVEIDSRFYDAILDNGRWAVSIVSEKARPQARWLAVKGRPLEAQLAVVPHRRGPVSGAALLTESLATLECRTTAVHAAGDHVIVVGEVLALTEDESREDPLLYWQSTYHRLGERAEHR